MDFARKQLEKYGWTDGKGLGKNENGIPEAIKPKLKRSVAGIGHDQAAEHTDQWWNKLYDKAAKNVEIEEKNGRTKKIKTKDDTFKITNSSYHLNKSDGHLNAEEYSDFFVKKAVLTNGGCREEKVRDSESEEDKEVGKKDVFEMTDEELFAACKGRTAHKGARHGLKALGKLARIERQEQMLLSKPEYNGYSHSKKHKKDKQNQSQMDLDVIENTNLNNEDNIQIKKKKKKRKHCFSDEKPAVETSTLEPVLEENNDIEMNENETASCNTFKRNRDDHKCKKSKPKNKKKRNRKQNSDDELMDDDELNMEKLKKKKKTNMFKKHELV